MLSLFLVCLCSFSEVSLRSTTNQSLDRGGRKLRGLILISSECNYRGDIRETRLSLNRAFHRRCRFGMPVKNNCDIVFTRVVLKLAED